MYIKSDPKNDPSRLVIAVFIVATTLTIFASDYSVPTILLIPVGTFLWGLIVSSILAFLFILAKGYELRYEKKSENIIDRFNYVLYNLAVTAYVIVMGVILLSFIYKHLSEASKAGNVWASIGIGVIFIAIIAVINRKDITGLSHAAYCALKAKLHKSK